MKGMTLRMLAVLAALSLVVAACDSDDSTPVADTGGGGQDVVTGDDTATGEDVPAGADYVWLEFAIDDSANACYGDAELEWKGSFTYDAATNTLTYDPTWGGGAGPYVPLYDDGPLSAGGHEAEGATAGDHILTARVKMLSPDEETTVEYGAQVADGAAWIWQGSNGTVVVPAGSTDTITATGLTLAATGDIDLKLELHTVALDAGFPFDPATDTVTIKGEFTNWAEVALLDDGQKGDTAADDGIFTFLLSENVAHCGGLLMLADDYEFVYVISGVEYKDGNGDALATGVTAWTDYETRGTWSAEDVIQVTGGLGGKNTAVHVGPDDAM